MKTITQKQVTELAKDAAKKPRQRHNINLHNSADDHMQRMLNSWTINAYIRPHRHANPAKRESWVLLQGRLLVLEFNNSGDISKHALLSYDENLVIEIESGKWHTAIALEPMTVIYELKDGPYDPETDKEFAAWAPAEQSPEGKSYMNYILKELGYYSFVCQQEFVPHQQTFEASQNQELLTV